MLKSVAGSIILVIVLILFILLFNKNKQEEVVSYFPNNIQSFCINNICFNQNNLVWMMKDAGTQMPADKDKTETLLKSLVALKLDNLVSINKEREAELGFSDQQSIIISVGDKKLEVGGIGPDYDSTFVRIPGSAEKYLVPFVLVNTNLITSDYWKNLTITNLPLYQIKKINEFTPDNEGNWEKPLWVEKIAHLTATNFDINKYDLKDAKVFVVTEEGGITTLKVGRYVKANKSVYWATTDDIYFYNITKTDFDLLTLGK